jgi:conjugative transposon TraM protein
MSNENDGNSREPDVVKTKKESKPHKELTPQEIQKRKKMLVYPLLFLIFIGAMWLIFAPSGDKDEQKVNGFNPELPIPKDENLIGDKRKAYQQEAMQNKQKEKMRSLEDFAYALNENEDRKSQEEYEHQAASPSNQKDQRTPQSTPTINSSVNAYQDINKQLGSWYEEPAKKEDEQAQLAVESRIQELERKLDEESARKRAQEEQLEFMDKSYQIAAKYMPQSSTQGNISTNSAGEIGNGSATASGKTMVQPVKQVRQSVVSLLSAPMDNAEFAEAYSKPRNLGFLTAAGNEGVQDKNSIRACVYQTITLTNGKELQIRLLEPMRAGNILIPANSIITGSCRITGERMDVNINSIQYADNIIPVELLVYDTDGQRGIFVPGNDEVKAAKEVAATLANSAGTSIMISDNAGSQLAADMGKGLIQGASQYVSKKMSVVKITLKANYKLLLLPKT